MWAGGGIQYMDRKRQGEGVICSPPGFGLRIHRPGCPVRQAAHQDALKYANYGKGVTFQLKNPEAAQFVNTYQDVVSADNYWFTDPYICSLVEGGAVFANGRDLTDDECRARRTLRLDRRPCSLPRQPAGSKPVWAFVEVGHPFSETDSLTITGPRSGRRSGAASSTVPAESSTSTTVSAAPAFRSTSFGRIAASSQAHCHGSQPANYRRLPRY